MIKHMTDAGLIEHYWSLRALAYNGAQVKSPGLGRTLKHLDITVAVIRQRRLNIATGLRAA